MSGFPAKSFLPLKTSNKRKKFLPGTRRAPTLTAQGAEAIFTKPKLNSTAGDFPFVPGVFFLASGQAARLFNIVSHYRPGHRVCFITGLSSSAYNAALC